jgi:hypothetical protein
MSVVKNLFSKGKLVAVMVAAGALAAGLAGTSASASPPVGATVETILTGAFNQPTTVHSENAKDFVIQKLTLQPGGETGWHWHPGVVVLTVEKGALTRVTKTKRGCTVETFTAGTSFIKQGTDVLNGYNRTSEVTEITVTYIKPENTPLRYEATDPGC